MGIITFPNGKFWFYANWCFDRLILDTLAERPEDGDFQEKLSRAEDFQHLNVGKVEPDLRTRILKSMRIVAQRTICDTSGALRRGRTEEQYVEYQQIMHELVERIDEALQGS